MVRRNIGLAFVYCTLQHSVYFEQLNVRSIFIFFSRNYIVIVAKTMRSKTMFHILK